MCAPIVDTNQFSHFHRSCFEFMQITWFDQIFDFARTYTLVLLTVFAKYYVNLYVYHSTSIKPNNQPLENQLDARTKSISMIRSEFSSKQQLFQKQEYYDFIFSLRTNREIFCNR